jgi:hypothetical protein
VRSLDRQTIIRDLRGLFARNFTLVNVAVVVNGILYLQHQARFLSRPSSPMKAKGIFYKAKTSFWAEIYHILDTVTFNNLFVVDVCTARADKLVQQLFVLVSSANVSVRPAGDIDIGKLEKKLNRPLAKINRTGSSAHPTRVIFSCGMGRRARPIN